MRVRSMALEGKTKKLYPLTTVVDPQDVVTWHNGESAPMEGKGMLTVRTVAPLFRLLNSRGRPTVFERTIPGGKYLARCAETIKFEVVVRFRNEEKGSLHMRRPELPIGTLPEPLVEFYLKSHGEVFDGIELPGDDPLVYKWSEDGVYVVAANGKEHPLNNTFVPFVVEGWKLADIRDKLEEMALTDATIVRDGLATVGLDMGDVKLEYGFMWVLDQGGLRMELALVEAPSNDEWRVRDSEGRERSKQNIRNGKKPVDAIEDYEFVANAVERIAI